jgi:serine phosphatase RsbU (regulator of sigma subunit)
MKLNLTDSFGINLVDAWKQEYIRIGSIYAKWGALLVIFLFPLSVIPELSVPKPNINIWYLFRFGPSVIMAVVFLIHQKFKFSHELLFEIIAFCLFTSGAYMVDCSDWMGYIISVSTIFFTSAVLVILRPFYFIINFIVVMAIQVMVHSYFCDASLADYFLMRGVNILIVIGVACFSIAAFRYYILKNNFMHRVALQEAHFELQERNQSLIKAQQDLRFKSNQISEQNEELQMQKEEIQSQRDAMEQQKDYIERQNRDIIGSIRYAKRIQNAMLPSEKYFKSILPNSFIYYVPRDIVSGDFYYAAEVNGKKVIAAVDCTGHGVPGAFMSLIGETNLNEIVIGNQITSPEYILEALHEGVYNMLRQSESENQDGMDVALVVIDEENEQIEFAGAKSPLVTIDVNGKLNVYKGDKVTIGGQREDGNLLSFKKQSVPFQKGMHYYLFSDGYADQFGGTKDKKFMLSSFKQLLVEVSKLPIIEQYNVLDRSFIQWKNGFAQTDDVMVIGFKL